jgi:hypothetical protein
MRLDSNMMLLFFLMIFISRFKDKNKLFFFYYGGKLFCLFWKFGCFLFGDLEIFGFFMGFILEIKV